MMKKGFTIIELLVVLAIIGILLGIVTTAAASSIKQARARKADACCTIVKQALATFYAQEGRWPGSIGRSIEGGSVTGSGNNPDVYELQPSEIKSMMLDVINKVKDGNPMMDISGLFVSRSSDRPREVRLQNGSVTYRPAKGAFGLDFWDAVKGRKKDSPYRMTTGEMNFGYPYVDGGFMPFRVLYSIPTDEMRVEKWP